ncbi:helix-turn-helix transcriptional regulator [Lysinibacillus sp. FSL L8-0312]|uniref:helix-turn-helix domain-containing protein n=1 Tax=Lysinibacillus sp. FSL L8-0312 TaxID=2921521 RepID=UPI0030F4B614
MSELGDLLKKLRGNKSLREIAELTELSHTYISDIEKGFRRGSKKPLHPSPDTLRRLANAYNYPYEKLMKIAGYIEFNGEILPPLTEKDERDLEKDLERVLSGVDSGSYANYGGLTLDDLDDEDRELLLASIENSMKLAKRLAKKKFTPKKYKDDNEQ